MADDPAELRRAVQDIEQMLVAAAKSGMLDDWVGQLAVELCAAVPGLGRDDAEALAVSIKRQPGRSVRAQGGLTAGALHSLKP